MASIAEVIEKGFDDGLDSTGQRMVREMRTLGTAGLLGWLLGYVLLPAAARPKGFVWEEDGEIVGNASLFPVEGHPERMVIANVAVLPEHRRRGIGSALTAASIQSARRKNAKQVILQVKHANQAALALYREQGFDVLGTKTTWIRSAGELVARPVHRAEIRMRKADQWHEQLQLAKTLAPEGPLWPLPLQDSLFRPPPGLGALKLGGKQHWIWENKLREIRGSLTAVLSRTKRAWKFILLAKDEEVINPLLAHSLRAIGADSMGVVIDYPHGQAESDFIDLGFRKERVLTWMKLKLSRTGNELLD
jgi:ribosomal-protein-alanine N-acetyltransferase